MIGEVVGSYRVTAKLGAGGMGTVWLAEHQLLGSRAAIKVLQPGMSAHEKIVQRFFDEARASSKIQDPGIVTVLDYGYHNGDAYIVMELLHGQTLTQRLGMDRMAPLQAMRLVQMAALAMAAAHARGIIHRDLKPDNIFVVGDPAVPGGERVKILDFGIAKLIDRDPDEQHQPTVGGAIMGTPAFMSPEQCRNAGEIDHRTDIYALGCVLFYLLCGRPPFIAQTPGDMIVAQLRDVPPVPSKLAQNISPEVDALVARCLAKNPDDRFASMTELVREGARITGDNHAVPTIPPMKKSGPMQGQETMASIISADFSNAAPTQPSEPPNHTTLGGSAHAAPTIKDPKPRYGVLALMIVILVGAFVGVSQLRSKPQPIAAPVEHDASIDAAAPIDAQPMTAPIIDAHVVDADPDMIELKPDPSATKPNPKR
ncbi:MAG: serine/threonine-protein kinase [Kofleriaceae bacterium]